MTSYYNVRNASFEGYMIDAICIARKHNEFCDALIARTGGRLDSGNWRRMGQTEREWLRNAFTGCATASYVTVGIICDALYDASMRDLPTRLIAFASGVPYTTVTASNYAPIGYTAYQPSPMQVAPAAAGPGISGTTGGRRKLVIKKRVPLPQFLIVAHENAEHVVVDTDEPIDSKATIMELLKQVTEDPEASKIPHGAYTNIGTGNRTEGDVNMLEAGVADVEDIELKEPTEGPIISLAQTTSAPVAKAGFSLRYGGHKISGKLADPLHPIIIIGRSPDNTYKVLIPDDDQPRFTASSAAKILAEQVLSQFPEDEFGIYANMSKTKTKTTKGTVQKVAGLKISGK